MQHFQPSRLKRRTGLNPSAKGLVDLGDLFIARELVSLDELEVGHGLAVAGQ